MFTTLNFRQSKKIANASARIAGVSEETRVGNLQNASHKPCREADALVLS
jgi:hypothetical protein